MEKKIPFNQVPVGRKFLFANNTWYKKSTRTASMLSPSHMIGKWFYFNNLDSVELVSEEQNENSNQN